MKQKVSHYFWVGLFTLGIGILTLALLVIMTGQQADSVDYHSYYDNVTGLSYGTPVYFEGYRVGQIETIAPEFEVNKVRFKVTYSVFKEWQIPSNSTAQINAGGLIADMSININGGDARTYFEADDVIPGKPPSDLFTQLAKTSDKINDLTDDKISPMLDMLNERLDRITGQIDRALPDILTNIKTASEDLAVVLENSKAIVSGENQQKITDTLTNLTALTEQVKGSIDSLDQGLNNINGLVTDTRGLLTGENSEMVQILKAASYVMQHLSGRIENLMNDVESAGRNLNEATNEIRKDPSKLIFSGKSEIKDEEL
ncbi:MAG: MCE family protein [Proteobacteria bacterium]|nr:MAG: MCE family protein [Pseudomonadota bacterium]